MLKHTFVTLLETYTSDQQVIDDLWDETEQAYSNPERYYHTLAHLDTIFMQLTLIQHKLNDWDVILFTLFYHDIVYKASRTDNEERSAALAVKRMERLSVPQERIVRCRDQILATKKHLQQTDPDTNYFTDADLAVLGQDWHSYKQYSNQIRKEYAVYPDFLYIPGRKKVLNHFLNMPRIFKTDYFFNKLEAQAKNNLKQESEFLDKNGLFL